MVIMKKHRLLKRNELILEDFKKRRAKKTIEKSKELTAKKFEVSTALVHQVVFNPKFNHSPLNQN